MSAITEAFKQHRIWQLLVDWGRALDQALDVDFVDADATDAIARMRAVLTFLGKRLENADPYLFPRSWLDHLATHVERITVSVYTFAKGDTAALSTAFGATDELLAMIAQAPSAATTSEFKGAKAAAEDYRKALDNAIRTTRGTIDRIAQDLVSQQNRLTEFAQEIGVVRTNATALASQFQNQFSAAQETRSQNEVAAQTDREARFTGLLETQKQALAERDAGLRLLEQEAQKTHDGLITSMRAEFTAIRDAATQAQSQQLTDLRSDFVDKATELHDEMNARKNEILKLVGVIGNAGVTWGFLDTANKAHTAMVRWQRVTVGSIVALIVVALFLFLPQTDRNATFSWAGFAARVYVSLTFMALAGYAASEARSNQKSEIQNRRIAMELEAVRPFIVTLSDEQQEEFIKQLADRTFRGSAPLELERSLPPGTLQALETFGRTLVEAIKAGKK
jgi:hypothetical protein